ncbi:MAG: sigma-54 dependent transcriptional regulator [Bryobacteraceae bacterium]|nr:sigma-54 dependent transcriptional regulator [Bryobacteraceae bacterium]
MIDDDRQSLQLVQAIVEQPGVHIVTASEPEEGFEYVRRLRPEIVFLDLMMPRISGLELLDRIVEFDPAIDVILITAHYSTESAVEAIQRGAADYLNKPLAVEKVKARVDGLIADARRRRQAHRLDEDLLAASSFEGMVGRSPLMLEAFAKIRRVAPYFRTALVTGSTGTGKELVARALHRLSPVASGPFVVCNCAALPDALLESELFGYQKGAFTGAHADKEGLIEAAHNGVLFLDEIGELPPLSQAKLLRAIQNQEVQRLGSNTPRQINVRIVAATNRPLRALIANKQFREDLFFRMAMVEIKLPSLAERKQDLPLLVRHFLEYFRRHYAKPLEGLTVRAETLLSRYSWPGNVRELENAIGYAAMMTDSNKIDVPDLPESLHSGAVPEEPATASYPMVTVREMEKLHARRVLELVGGDKVRAAQVLGVSRATLYRLLSRRKPAE